MVGDLMVSGSLRDICRVMEPGRRAGLPGFMYTSLRWVFKNHQTLIVRANVELG